MKVFPERPYIQPLGNKAPKCHTIEGIMGPNSLMIVYVDLGFSLLRLLRPSGQHTIGFRVSRAAVGLGCCDVHWASMKLKAHQLRVGGYIWSVYVYVNIDVYEHMSADTMCMYTCMSVYLHIHVRISSLCFMCIYIYVCI